MEHFEPPVWLRNPHLQTVLAALPHAPVGLPKASLGVHLTLPLPDRDESLHAWALWQDAHADAVLIVHGVGGSSDSPYVRRAAYAAYRQGMHALCLDLRGAGRGVALAHTLYHAGLIEDLDVAVHALRSRADVRRVGIMGLSLGGQAALLAAARWRHRPYHEVPAVVAISAPMDLDSACEALDTRANRLYQRYILNGLVRRATLLARRSPERVPVSPRHLRRLQRVRDYDDAVIAPMHGFANAEYYYREVSCGPHLAEVVTPVLCIVAQDDPIVPYSTLVTHLRRAAPNVHVRRYAFGGHLGFCAGVGHTQYNWAFYQGVQFLRQAIHIA